MDTKKYVNTLWKELRESINLAYKTAAEEKNEDGECLRDYAENISWSDDLATLLDREAANERQHRSGRPSVPGFSVDTAAKLILLGNMARGAEMAIKGESMPKATTFLVRRKTAAEAQIVGYLTARFLQPAWIASVRTLDYAELMKKGENR